MQCHTRYAIPPDMTRHKIHILWKKKSKNQERKRTKEYADFSQISARGGVKQRPKGMYRYALFLLCIQQTRSTTKNGFDYTHSTTFWWNCDPCVQLRTRVQVKISSLLRRIQTRIIVVPRYEFQIVIKNATWCSYAMMFFLVDWQWWKIDPDTHVMAMCITSRDQKEAWSLMRYQVPLTINTSIRISYIYKYHSVVELGWTKYRRVFSCTLLVLLFGCVQRLRVPSTVNLVQLQQHWFWPHRSAWDTGRRPNIFGNMPFLFKRMTLYMGVRCKSRRSSYLLLDIIWVLIMLDILACTQECRNSS